MSIDDTTQGNALHRNIHLPSLKPSLIDRIHLAKLVEKVRERRRKEKGTERIGKQGK